MTSTTILNALRNLEEVVRQLAAQIKTEDDEYTWDLLNGVRREIEMLREEAGERPKT